MWPKYSKPHPLTSVFYKWWADGMCQFTCCRVAFKSGEVWPLDDLNWFDRLKIYERKRASVLLLHNENEVVWKHWKQATATRRLGDAESPRRAFFRRCYPGALQIVIVSDNLWKLHVRTATLEESTLKSRVGGKPGKAFGYIGKKADDMWRYGFLMFLDVSWKGSDMDWRAACLGWTNTCILLPGAWEQVK